MKNLEIFLEGRKIDGDLLDYSYIECQEDNAKFNVKYGVDCNKYKNLETGSIIWNDIILNSENITSETIDFIKKIASGINLIAKELKSDYNSIRANTNIENALVGPFMKSLTPEDFRVLTYIEASRYLENFVSKYRK